MCIRNPWDTTRVLHHYVLSEKEIKAEAYKECIEKVKEKAYTYSDITGYQSTVVDVNEINGVYEELVGKDNASLENKN